MADAPNGGDAWRDARGDGTATRARRCRWRPALVVIAAVLVIGIGALAGDVGRRRPGAVGGRCRGAGRRRRRAAGGGRAWRRRNGATLVAWRGDGDAVVVTVRVGRRERRRPGRRAAGDGD